MEETITIWSRKMRNGVVGYWKRFDAYKKTHRISKAEFNTSKNEALKEENLVYRSLASSSIDYICYIN
jgi:hypothetical protein